jgi:hypothetical protein
VIPDDLVIQACRDLQAKIDNAGSWPDGIPESFYQIKQLRKLDDDTWVWTVESIIRNEAVRIVSKTETE